MHGFKYFNPDDFDFDKFLGPEGLRLGKSARGSKRAADPILESIGSSGSDMDSVAPSKKKKPKLKLVASSSSSSSSSSGTDAKSPFADPVDIFGVGAESGFHGEQKLDGSHREFGIVFNGPNEDNKLGPQYAITNELLQKIVGVAKTLHEAGVLNYFAVKREIGSKKQGIHGQAYAWFTKPQKYTTVRNYWIHLNPAVACQERRAKYRKQLRGYVFKAETTDPAPGSGPFEVGVFKDTQPGHRTDLDNLCEMLKEGKTQRELFEASPATWCRNFRSLKAAEAFVGPPVTLFRDPPKILVLWGETGGGKSKLARKTALQAVLGDEKQVYVYDNEGMFWNDYTSQKAVIFEDFPGTSDYYKYPNLLRLLDPYTSRGNRKGDHMYCHATHFIFTSNLHPKDWYKFEAYNKGQLLRRIAQYGKVIHIQKNPEFDKPIELTEVEMTEKEYLEELSKA